jgi:hypothetical protein
MERADRGHGAGYDAARKAGERMNISDLHGGNLGIRKADGRAVIIDYACGW